MVQHLILRMLFTTKGCGTVLACYWLGKLEAEPTFSANCVAALSAENNPGRFLTIRSQNV